MNSMAEISELLDIMAQDIENTEAMQKKYGALFITREAYDYLIKELGVELAGGLFFSDFTTIVEAKEAVEWIKKELSSKCSGDTKKMVEEIRKKLPLGSSLRLNDKAEIP